MQSRKEGMVTGYWYWVHCVRREDGLSRRGWEDGEVLCCVRSVDIGVLVRLRLDWSLCTLCIGGVGYFFPWKICHNSQLLYTSLYCTIPELC